ncbi:hypothetical protein [Mameliella alba]|uniref:hypothetical protein n=1 Tax=Mameliella alba TaxID=561184 RepID=UPI001054A6CA|nr:hypothetical protein [Mameliella alba]
MNENRRGEKAARTVILRAIETWTGHGLDEVGGLPIVRDGHFLGYDSGLAAMLTDPIQTVTFGIWTEDSSALLARLKEYKRLRNSLIQVQSLLTNMDLAARLRIRRASHPESGSLQEKIINSLGSQEAVLFSTRQLISEIDREINSLEREIYSRGTMRGRPRIEARYRVAEQFAKLFAKVTGERPTFSEGPDGLSGKFSPKLGSGLVLPQSQKMTVAARAIAEKKVCGHRS